jgi:hypothetical protein
VEALDLPANFTGNLLSYPEQYLADYVEREADDDGEVEELPSSAARAGEQSRLFSNTDGFYPLDWLIEKRGLTEDAIRSAGIGWDGRCFTIPVYDAHGALCNVVRRPWPASRGAKYLVMKGRGTQLYPRPLPHGPWIIGEGVLDAILARFVHGLPVVTATNGQSFPAAWLPLVKDRLVAVAYDVGAEQAMYSRVAQLNAAGAKAWPVRLARLGLPDKGDLTTYLMNGGAKDLRRFINDEYRSAA